ncbi:MAG TPA: response regulator [Bacteroidia bacterium]|nr:response regulator [Sphingobacteriales bacterium]HPD64190.1 response regulator [Bacteroidia bacterium]HRS57930.1 response regulator [Bacteroidia bacterium]HRU67973.1 response regulator [Bacteroidia bacterium]
MVDRKLEFDWYDKLVLIVEDIETNHLLIDSILKRTNCNVMWAMDGETAIEICREHPEIDLVLMDIRLPGIDGYEATREIRKFRPDLPIIAQSAYIYDNNKHQVFEAGCNDFITKPIKKEILLKKCDKYIRK